MVAFILKILGVGMMIVHKAHIVGGMMLFAIIMAAVPAQAMSERTRHFLRFHEYPKEEGNLTNQESVLQIVPQQPVVPDQPVFAREENVPAKINSGFAPKNLGPKSLMQRSRAK